MDDVLYLERLDQAETLLKPRRIELLRLLAEPRSCSELGSKIGEPPQKVYYHVKRLEAAGIVARVGERKVRALTEAVYQARARTYWLSPDIVGHIGTPERATDELSLGYLLDLVGEVQADIGTLASSRRATPSLGMSGEIRLIAERRDEFLRDLRAALEEVLSRYGGDSGDRFRIALACYRKGDRK